MRKIATILVFILLISELSVYPCHDDACLRAPLISWQRPLDKTPEENIEPTPLEIAMLGDMVDDPKVREAFPKVRAHIKNPAYLYYAMKVYLYDPAFFERLIREGISEKIIADIGWGLRVFPEGVKSALEKEIPFRGLWVTAPRKGWLGVSFGTAYDFSAHPAAMEQLLATQHARKMRYKNFMMAFKLYPEETLRLIDEFGIWHDKKDLYKLAKAIKKYPLICSVLRDRKMKNMDTKIIIAVALLINNNRIPLSESKNILAGFDKEAWNSFAGRDITTVEDIADYIGAFYIDKKEAQRFHDKYPFQHSWLKAFKILKSGNAAELMLYRDLVNLGLPENRLNAEILHGYEANPEFFKWLLTETDMEIENIVTLIDYLCSTRLDRGVLSWLKNSGLIKSGIDIGKLSRLIYEYISLAAHKQRDDSIEWVLSIYKEGNVSLGEMLDLFKIYVNYQVGVKNALKAGVPIKRITPVIAMAFQNGPDTKEAKVVEMLIRAGLLMPGFNSSWLEFVSVNPGMIELWKQLMRFDGMQFSESQLRSLEELTGLKWFPFTVRVKGLAPAMFEIQLCVRKEDIVRAKNGKDVQLLGKDGRFSLSVVSIAISIRDDKIVVENLQSHLKVDKMSPIIAMQYQDRLQIALLILEQIFKETEIIIPTPASIIQMWHMVDSETAYNVYAKVPYKLGYKIMKLSDLSCSYRVLDSEIPKDAYRFWVKHVDKDTPRPLRDILLGQERTNSDLLRVPLIFEKKELTADEFDSELMKLFRIEPGDRLMHGELIEVNGISYTCNLMRCSTFAGVPFYFRVGDIFIINSDAEIFAEVLTRKSGELKRLLNRYPYWVLLKEVSYAWNAYEFRDNALSTYSLPPVIGVLIAIQEIKEELKRYKVVDIGSQNGLYANVSIRLGAGQAIAIENAISRDWFMSAARLEEIGGSESDDLITLNAKLNTTISQTTVIEAPFGEIDRIGEPAIAIFNLSGFGLCYYNLPHGHSQLKNSGATWQESAIFLSDPDVVRAKSSNTLLGDILEKMPNIKFIIASGGLPGDEKELMEEAERLSLELVFKVSVPLEYVSFDDELLESERRKTFCSTFVFRPKDISAGKMVQRGIYRGI